MFTKKHDVARLHRMQMRRRGDYEQSARLALARMLYGGHAR